MMNSKNRVLLILFIFIFLITRLPRLSNDILSTDAVYWHGRSENFINALDDRDYVETYQKYHPGVTLMWSTGLTAKALSLAYGEPIDMVFNDIISFHHSAKVTLIFWQLILSIFAIYLLAKIFDFEKAVFMIMLLALEPFYIGNSRLLHLDVPLSLYLFISMLCIYLAIDKKKIPYFILSGIFLGLGALTKSIALGGFMFVVGAGFVLSLVKRKFESKMLLYFALLIFVFFLTYFALFPALWIDPKGVLIKIFEESFRVGEVKGHEQIFFGKVSHDPGFWFYPTLFLLKLSLISIVGLTTYYVVKLVRLVCSAMNKNLPSLKDIGFIDFAGIFYLGYFIVLVYFDKKVDRYPMPIYPFITTAAVQGLYFIKKKYRNILVGLLSITLMYSLIRFFPHYMVYTNPIIGDAGVGNKIVGQKLFGIGIYELKEHILDVYGNREDIAINDPGPMQSIYDRDVYNVFIEHPNSYDLMILGPNKEPPPSVVNSGVDFEYSSSVYIGGLEFWRIFTKKSM